MAKKDAYDAVVVGSGPNGLAAAIELAKAGLSVIVYEEKATIGGGLRSGEVTLPGYIHDICSAVHPLGIGSPFFRSLSLDRYDLDWIQPPIPMAHPFDNGTAALLQRSLKLTAESLGPDALAYQKLMEPLVNSWDLLKDDLLAPLHFPYHPISLARFAWRALRSARGLAEKWFVEEHTRTFFAGLAAHSIMPLEKKLTAAFGLILAILGHVVGWPIPRGGSQKIADALASCLRELGGQIVTLFPVTSIDILPPAEIYLFDVTPRQFLEIAGEQLPQSYRNQLHSYRYGPGVFKIDWALSHPIPWKAKECSRAGTVHLGASLNEISYSEAQVWNGVRSEVPYVILSQPSLFDPSRAPQGRHTAWGYCHVPHASHVDMRVNIEAQIERFAPGFKDCILARHCKTAMEMEKYNSNYVGGDINGGVQDFYQLFTRPTVRWIPYATPVKGLYICSSSTPPGGGVHGMCGFHAARAALRACSKS